jgi:hypothetical protein
MRNHFKDLKDAEVEALRRRRRVGEIPPKIISRLRKLVSRCRRDPEAEAAICYHGSLALIYEFDRNWLSAAKHRGTEISFIEKARALMAKEASSVRRWALSNYKMIDLKKRRGILKQLERMSKTEPAASPNRRPAARSRVRRSGKGGGRPGATLPTSSHL